MMRPARAARRPAAAGAWSRGGGEALGPPDGLVQAGDVALAHHVAHARRASPPRAARVDAGAHEDHAERRPPDPQLLRHPEGRGLVDRGPQHDGVLGRVGLEPLAQRLQARDDMGLADGAAQRLGDDRVEIADRRHHSAPGLTASTEFLSSGVHVRAEQAEVQRSGARCCSARIPGSWLVRW